MAFRFATIYLPQGGRRGASRDFGRGSVDEVRQQISPGRIGTAQWIDLIQTAHDIGIPTTSTIMYGHIESSRHKAVHLDILRDIQTNRRHQ